MNLSNYFFNSRPSTKGKPAYTVAQPRTFTADASFWNRRKRQGSKIETQKLATATPELALRTFSQGGYHK